MNLAKIKAAASQKQLRQFSVLWALFFGAAAAWEGFFRGDGASCVVFMLLAVIGLPGYVHPTLIRPVYIAALIVTQPIGWFVSHMVLSVIYYGVFSPLAMLFRLTGRDVLKLSSRACDSYWTDKPQVVDKRRYFHQY